MNGKRHFLNAYLLFLCVFALILGIIYESPITITIASVGLIIHNIGFSLFYKSNRIVYLCFQVTMFIFLLGRQVVRIIDGVDVFDGYTLPVQVESATLISLSILTMAIYTYFSNNKIVLKTNNMLGRVGRSGFAWGNDINTKHIRKIATFFCVITFISAMIVVAEKIVFRSVYSLQDYYVMYTTFLPIIIYKLGDAYLISFYTYLATLPSKKEAKLQISLFLIYSFSTLAYGVRNIVVLNGLSLIIYCVIRNKTDSENWFSRKHFKIMLMSLPVVIIFLQGFDYIRRTNQLVLTEIFNNISFDVIMAFFQSQGISAEIIPLSMVSESLLGGQPVHYTFGILYNYITQNMVTIALTGNTPIHQNTIESALYGGSLGARLAYIGYSQTFLDGVGMGSTFIAELFTDFSFLGVILGSIFLAWVLLNIVNYCSKGIFCFAFGMVAIRWIIYVPRDSFTNWIVQAFSIMNILIIFFIWLLTIKSMKKREGIVKR